MVSLIMNRLNFIYSIFRTLQLIQQYGSILVLYLYIIYHYPFAFSFSIKNFGSEKWDFTFIRSLIGQLPIFNIVHKNATMHNEAKSPGRVHFLDFIIFLILNPFFELFYAWRPYKNTQKWCWLLHFFIIIKFENG